MHGVALYKGIVVSVESSANIMALKLLIYQNISFFTQFTQMNTVRERIFEFGKNKTFGRKNIKKTDIKKSTIIIDLINNTLLKCKLNLLVQKYIL